MKTEAKSPPSGFEIRVTPARIALPDGPSDFPGSKCAPDAMLYETVAPRDRGEGPRQGGMGEV